VPLRTTLHSGDIVEVLSTKKNNASLDWLDFLKTSRARQKVRSYFRKKELEDAYLLGEELFTKRFRKTKYKLKNVSEMEELMQFFKINDTKTFLAKIGKGELLISEIKHAIHELDMHNQVNQPDSHEISGEKDVINEARQKTKGIRIYDIDHKQNCKNPGFLHLQKTEPERIIHVDWCYENEGKEQTHIDLDIIGKRRTGFLLEILNKFAEMKIDLTYTNMKSKNNQSIGAFSFYVQNVGEMDKILIELYDVQGIQNIKWQKK
jgi:GTP pyrophosphokinase